MPAEYPLHRMVSDQLMQFRDLAFHPVRTIAIIRARGDLGLPRSAFVPWVAAVRWGSHLAALRMLEGPTQAPYKHVGIIEPIAYMAAIGGNGPLVDEALGTLFDSLYTPHGIRRDEGAITGAGTANMVAAYRMLPQLVQTTPWLADAADTEPDRDIVSLLIGQGRGGIDREINHLAGMRDTLRVFVPALLGLAAGFFAGRATNGLTANWHGFGGGTLRTLIGGVEGAVGGNAVTDLVTTRLDQGDSDDNDANTRGAIRTVGTLGGGLIGLATGVFPRIPALPSMTGALAAGGAYGAGQWIMDRVLPRGDELRYEAGRWVGPGGIIAEAGLKTRHLTWMLVGLRDALFINQTNRGFQPSLLATDFNLAVPTDQQAEFERIVRSGNFARFHEVAPRLLSELAAFDTEQVGNQSLPSLKSPSDMLLTLTFIESGRQMRMQSDRQLPHPEDLEDFVNTRCVSRLQASRGIPTERPELKLALLMPTLFRTFAFMPEYVTLDPKFMQVLLDLERFGQAGDNSGNTGIFPHVLRRYFQALYASLADISYMQRFFHGERERPVVQAEGPLDSLRSPFNEIVGQPLAEEVLSWALAIGLDLDPDNAPLAGGVKEFFKTLANEIKTRGDIASNPESLIMYVGALCCLRYGEKALRAYKKYYEAEKPDLAQYFDRAIANIHEITEDYVEHLLGYFLRDNPRALIEEHEGKLDTSKAFTFLMYMLALENPQWLEKAVPWLKALVTGSGKGWGGTPYTHAGLYGLFFVSKLLSPNKDQVGRHNRYGLDTQALAGIDQSTRDVLTTVACDIIRTSFGAGPSVVGTEARDEDYYTQATASLSICAERMDDNQYKQLLNESLSQLKALTNIKNLLTENPNIRRRAVALCFASAELVRIAGERQKEFSDSSDDFREQVLQQVKDIGQQLQLERWIANGGLTYKLHDVLLRLQFVI